MNTLKKILLLTALCGVIVACKKDNAPADPNVPSFDNDYSPQEMNTLHTSYFQCRTHDIYTPPAVVTTAFNKQFKKVRDVEWERGCNLYEVSFEIDQLDYDALFDTSGNLLLYKYDIPGRQLPAAVTNAIAKKYSNYRIDDVNKVVLSGYNSYDVELESAGRDLEIYIKEDGTVVHERID